MNHPLTRIFVLLSIIGPLAGCGTMYKLPDDDLSIEYIEVGSEIDDSDIETYELHPDIDSIGFVVLNIEEAESTTEYRTFLEQTLMQIGLPEILGEEEYARRIIDSGHSESLTSGSDLVSLHRAAGVLGGFLHITTTLVHTGEAWWDHEVIIRDASTGTVMLEMRRRDLLWANLDTEFNYRTLNLIRRWYVESGGG
jgi:hypothetical protein